VTTISTEKGAPVIAAARLRAGRAHSAKGAARMIAQATGRAGGVTGEIVLPGDCAYGTGPVVAACRRAGVRFSLAVTKNQSVTTAISAIPDDAWTPVSYPGAVRDPDTGTWISQAEVAEIPYTAFASTRHGSSMRTMRGTRNLLPSSGSRRLIRCSHTMLVTGSADIKKAAAGGATAAATRGWPVY
jgi:hypothetical protein